MASKVDMFQELLEVYQNYTQLFEINKIKYLKWLDTLKTYDQVRAAYRFMFNKLYLCIKCWDKVWKCHSPEVWWGLQNMNKGCDEVIHLNKELKDFRIVWKGRPKFRKGQR